MRRVLDIVVSSLVLVTTLPILLVAAIAIKLDSSGPVISRHARVGRNGTPFELLRLRSTVHEAHGKQARSGECQPVVIERSVGTTRVGRILRGASIDELPQLWNVLRGDMSLIGPPPEAPDDAPAGASSAPSPGASDRIRLVPGLTGTWSSAERPDHDRDTGRHSDQPETREHGGPDSGSV
jgi:lipopolysaccharide/colanic/teichoic acid biosynthesis glycosyltransferase